MGRHNASHGRGGSHQNTSAQQAPQWEDMGGGVLSLKSNPNTHIKLAGGQRGAFRSVGLKETQPAAQVAAVGPAEAGHPISVG